MNVTLASTKAGKDAQRMDLSDLIALSRKVNVLSEKSADLCAAVRFYRNLIHPGRAVRLGETIGEDVATIARSLVGIVAEELAQRRSATRGYTAEQIAKKLQDDERATAILGHLLEKTELVERTRLLLDVLPNAYFDEIGEEGPGSPLSLRYRDAFRIALDTVDDGVKRRVARRFAEIVKDREGWYVIAFGNAFFRGSDLTGLESGDFNVVKDHLLDRLKTGIEATLPLMDGMPLKSADAMKWIDPLVQEITTSRAGEALRKRILEHIWSVEGGFDEETRKLVLERFDDWEKFFEKGDQPDHAMTVKDLKSTILPF